MSKIASTLSKLFHKHHSVSWYDTDKELRPDYESLYLPDVEKVEINSQLSLKFHILRKKPDQKFLLYYEGPKPPYLENLVLDV